MLGKTHIAVGCAIYFCVAQPTDFKSLFAGVAISIIGSEVSDIDEANSKVRRVFNWLLVGIVLLAAAATFIKNQFELTLNIADMYKYIEEPFHSTSIGPFIRLFQSSSQCYAFYIDRPHSQWYNRSLDRAVWILLFCCISITCFTGYLKSQVSTIILSAENRSQI